MRERRITLGLAPALPAIVLVVVIAWALAAVLLLTGTLVNAREIDDTIPLINDDLGPIDQELDHVERAVETARITDQIREAAAPLNDQAQEVLVEARSIDRRLGSILGRAGSINETAKAINGRVGSIGTKVGSINSKVVSINDTVDSIEGSVLAINSNVSSIGRRVSSIGGHVGSIGTSVDSILVSFVGIDEETRSIDPGLDRASARRAQPGIELGALIKGDFGRVRTLVGEGSQAGHSTAGPGSIHGHANSIDCAPLLGGTPYCGQ